MIRKYSVWICASINYFSTNPQESNVPEGSRRPLHVTSDWFMSLQVYKLRYIFVEVVFSAKLVSNLRPRSAETSRDVESHVFLLTLMVVAVVTTVQTLPRKVRPIYQRGTDTLSQLEQPFVIAHYNSFWENVMCM